MKVVLSGVGQALRETGQALDRAGASLQGNFAFREQLSRHRRIMPLTLNGTRETPQVAESAFVAPNAAVIGNVRVGDRAAVWYGAVLRGDRSAIAVESGASLGDRVVVHGTTERSVTVESGACVGPAAVLHGCHLARGATVGAGATVMGKVEAEGEVSAGSVVTENTTVGAGQLWGGSPAKFLRNLTADEIRANASLAAASIDLAHKHAEEHNRSESQRQSLRDHIEFNKDARGNEYKEQPF